MHCVTEAPWSQGTIGYSSTVVDVPITRRVLLVDDHELIRYGVRSLYPEIDGLAIEWMEADSLEQALDVYARHGPIDAVLLDLNLRSSNFLLYEGSKWFQQMSAQPRVRKA